MTNTNNTTTMKLENMNKEALKALCRANQLCCSGNKVLLIARLKAANIKPEDIKPAPESLGEVATKEDESPKPRTYAVNAMRAAIIAAHSLNNRSAITEQDAVMSGTTSERFHQWVLWVNDLRDTVVAYTELKHKKSATKPELTLARNRIFPAWRNILAVGEESNFAKEMFIREEDVDSLVGYAETFVGTRRGTQQANTTAVIFRKYVEALLGCRIAANAVMKDADRDLLMECYAAQNRMAALVKQLNGSETKTGEHKPGILDNIKSAEKELEAARQALIVLNISEEDVDNLPMIVGMRVNIKKLRESAVKCQDNLAKAKKEVERLEERASEIEESFNLIADML